MQVLTQYGELIAAAAVILVTLAGIIAITLIVGKAGKTRAKKPQMKVTILYDPDCECFEYQLERFLCSRDVCCFEADIAVEEPASDQDSEMWLCELKKKLGGGFRIVKRGGGTVGEN
ncbi:MAG TPA: hypothetical protein IAC39_02480 [Candidatus Faeciplasma pullistercoris]|uniref:Transmembrane protein n=1 Tax=Candidatus Faeciplasma pullistercoris TaxID=2840800 RepID=A0A9D1KJ61_9FIRM|nr:hypothetical protein [Candidatus Faeciplasma pullistercoris]